MSDRKQRKVVVDDDPADSPESETETPAIAVVTDVDDPFEPDTADPTDPEPPAAPPPAESAAPTRREQRVTRRAERRELRESVRKTPGMQEIGRREDQDLRDYILSLTSGAAQIKVMISRTSPEMYMGMSVKGHLETVDHPVDEQWIKDRHGGGKFAIKVQKLTDTGQYHYVKNILTEIAGDPITTALEYKQAGKATAPAAPPPPSPGDTASAAILSRALDVVSRPPTPSPGLDPALIHQVTQPLREEMQRLRDSLIEKDRALTEAINKPRDPYQDRFVQKLMDDDSARIATIKTAHDAEIRTLRENHREDTKRMEDRHQREMDHAIRTHEREISNLKEAHARELTSIKTGYDAQIIMHQTTKVVVDETRSGELKRLERENETLRKEVTELRARKDKTVLEQLKDVNAIKEALGVDEGGDDDKGLLARAIESPLLGKLVDKIGSAVSTEKPPPQMPHGFAPGIPYKLTMSNGSEGYFVNNPDGTTRQLPAPKQRITPKTGDANGTAAPTIEIDPADLKMAIDFMESAHRSGKNPAEFAQSVRNMVPASVLKGFAAMGVDDFLDKVAQLEATHLLSTPTGRAWARQVGAALTGKDA